MKNRIRSWGSTVLMLWILAAGTEVTAQSVFFGDLHVHSAFSLDAIGPIDSIYIRGQRDAKLDFICVTDHDHSLTETTWDSTKTFVTKYYQPGKFVTFSGYEFTAFVASGTGHNTVIYKGLDGPFVSASFNTITEMFDLMRNQQVVLGVAHPDYSPYSADTSAYSGLLQRTIEVYGSNGYQFEYFGNPHASLTQLFGYSVQDRLKTGKVFGFTAVSDDHAGRPGKLGLTAIVADTLTREALFTALKARRCYATTGARILMDFTCNGFPLGSVLERDKNYLFQFHLSVKGAAQIAKVEVVKNNATLYRWNPRETDTLDIGFSDVDSNRAFYYVRVTQANGHAAWTSPFYVNIERGDRVLNNTDSNVYSFAVGNGYPNPFNQGVTIPVTVPSDHVISLLTVDIYNILGRRVYSLERPNLESGKHLITWDGMDDRHLPLPSGVYYCLVRVGRYRHTTPVMMVK